MKCRVEITDSTPREEYSRPVDYHNFTEPGESRRISPVKVTSIQAQRKVWLGGDVPVHVTVANYVNHDKVAEVILQDYTNNAFIGRSEVVIPPQSSRTLTFHWKTRGFSLGEHVLHAEAISDPEPYYEYDNMSTERYERSNRMNDEGNYIRRQRDGELQEIVAEAEEILRRVEREWEDASTARDRAQTEAEYIIREADEIAHEQTREIDGKADAIIDDAYREADDIVQEAEMFRKQAEEYRQKVESDAEANAAELREQYRKSAEDEALQIKDEAIKYAEELLAEVQKQLEAARTLRELAKDLADIAGFDTEEVEEEIVAEKPKNWPFTSLLSKKEESKAETKEEPEAEIKEEEPKAETGEEPEGKIEEIDPRQSRFELTTEEPEKTGEASDEVKPEAVEEPEQPEEEEETETESDDAPEQPKAEAESDAEDTPAQPEDRTDKDPDTDQPKPSRNLFRWQNIIMALSLVTAAVLLSFGLIYLG